MKKVVVAGSATLDILVRSNDFRVLKSHQVAGGVAIAEVYGGKTEADEVELETGGAGTNVSAGLSKLGIATAIISRTGDDWMRERIMNGLAILGVESSMVQTEKNGKTAISVILVAKDGGRSIITARGASQKIDPSLIEWEKIKAADFLQVSSLGGNMPLLEDLVAFAKSNGIRVGLNPGKNELIHQERLIELLPNVDLLVLNRMEAALLLRNSYAEVKELVLRLLRYGVKTAVVTDGKRGAGIGWKGRYISGNAFKTRSVDDTGAGDAFVAGLVAGLVEEVDMGAALKMGLANGASQVTALGAKKGLLTKKEMKNWLKKKLKMTEEKL